MRALTIVTVAFSWSFNLFGCDSLREEVEAVSRVKRSAAQRSSEINPLWNSTWTDKLRKDLLLNYDKFARPAEMGDKIDVRIDLEIKHIEMDEHKSLMTSHALCKMEWVDYKLKWNPDFYGGLKELHVANHEVWQPDIYAMNGVAGSLTDPFTNSYLKVAENGTVSWFPGCTFQVFCDMDLTSWPFDTQTCPIIASTWAHDGDEVDLLIMNRSRASHEMQNPEWEFVKLDKKRAVTIYECCSSDYIDVTFSLTVRRRSPTYVALLITPVTAIVVMALSVFLIHPASTDKITLGSITIVINCLFLLYFTQKLPGLAGRTPLIVLFYSRTLYLLSFSLIISVIVLNISRNPKFSPLPWSIKRSLTGCLGKWLLINTLRCKNGAKSIPNSSEVGDSLPVLSEQEKQHMESSNYESFQEEWITLAVAIDRIAFLIYCFIFIVFAITYSV